MQSDVWIIGSGDEDKDLVPHMIENGLMFIGPGSIGDVESLDKSGIHKLLGSKKRCKATSALNSFKNKAKKDQIVVARLGSVCFVVGVIDSNYNYSSEYSAVKSYWNKSYLPREDSWNLNHVRDVTWYALSNDEAIHYFRKGIYGSPLRFYKLGTSGKKSGKAKKELDTYLQRLGYNNKNAHSILKGIGTKVLGVNNFGFPA